MTTQCCQKPFRRLGRVELLVCLKSGWSEVCREDAHIKKGLLTRYETLLIREDEIGDYSFQLAC